MQKKRKKLNLTFPESRGTVFELRRYPPPSGQAHAIRGNPLDMCLGWFRLLVLVLVVQSHTHRFPTDSVRPHRVSELSECPTPAEDSGGPSSH